MQSNNRVIPDDTMHRDNPLPNSFPDVQGLSASIWGNGVVWITRRVFSSSLRTAYPWCLSHHPLVLLVQPLAHCRSRLLLEASVTYSSILEVQLSCSLPDAMDGGWEHIRLGEAGFD